MQGDRCLEPSKGKTLQQMELINGINQPQCWREILDPLSGRLQNRFLPWRRGLDPDLKAPIWWQNSGFNMLFSSQASLLRKALTRTNLLNAERVTVRSLSHQKNQNDLQEHLQTLLYRCTLLLALYVSPTHPQAAPAEDKACLKIATGVQSNFPEIPLSDLARIPSHPPPGSWLWLHLSYLNLGFTYSIDQRDFRTLAPESPRELVKTWFLSPSPEFRIK